MDMFSTFIVMTVSQVFVYVQIQQNVYIKYVQFVYINYTLVKLKRKKSTDLVL